MKIEKFPNRIQFIINEFETKENIKRWRYLIYVEDKILVVSRIYFNENTKKAFIKYIAQSGYKYL